MSRALRAVIGTASLASLAAVAEPAPVAAQVPSRPNIVFVLTDDQRIDEMPAMTFNDGGDWSTFTDMAANVPMCCPSRSTLLTGRYASETGVLSNSSGAAFDPSTTYATRLRSAGYTTFFVGKYLNGYPWGRGASYVPPGWDVWQAVDYAGTRDSGYEVDWRFQRTFSFIRDQEARDDRPWFAAVNIGKPHLPSRPPSRYATASVTLPPVAPSVRLTDKQAATVRSQRTARLRALLAVDEQMHRLVDTLRSTGELDRTVIVFTSDNGYLFGEHGSLGKAEHWDESVLVPTTVRWPGARGSVVDQQLQLIDLPVTFVSLARAAPLPGAHGADLSSLLADPGGVVVDRQWVYLEGPRRSWRGVRSTRWKYVRKGSTEHLYDLRQDPYERSNLASRSASRADLEAARRALAALEP